jgi:hypothetical protein
MSQSCSVEPGKKSKETRLHSPEEKAGPEADRR